MELSAQSKLAAETALSHAAVAALKGKLRRGQHRCAPSDGAETAPSPPQLLEQQQCRDLQRFAGVALAVSAGIDAAIESERAARSAKRAGRMADAAAHCVRGLRGLSTCTPPGCTAAPRCCGHSAGATKPPPRSPPPSAHNAACAQLRARLQLLFAECALLVPSVDEEGCDRPAAAATALADVLRGAVGGAATADAQLHATALRLRALSLQRLGLPLLRHAHIAHLLVVGRQGSWQCDDEELQRLHSCVTAELTAQLSARSAIAVTDHRTAGARARAPGGIKAAYNAIVAGRLAAAEGLARSALERFDAALIALEHPLCESSSSVTSRLVLARAHIECEFSCATCLVQLGMPELAAQRCNAALLAAKELNSNRGKKQAKPDAAVAALVCQIEELQQGLRVSQFHIMKS